MIYMRKCTSCGKQCEDSQFVSSRGFNTSTCLKCRERYNRSRNKNKEKQEEATQEWKQKNKEYISLMNSIYRNTKGMSKEDRKILIREIKKEKNITSKCKGIPSNHRKLHTEQNGIIGKICSVPECGWKPLIDYNQKTKAWDNLHSTCKECLGKKRILRKDKINANYRKRIATDPKFRIRERLKTRLHSALRYQNTEKTDYTIKYLGCSISFFKDYIESKFTDSMSWDKYGHYTDTEGKKQIGFHIDHIIPCNAFDLTHEEEIYFCFYYKNLQPMWGRENISKLDKYNEDEKIEYVNSVKDEIFGDRVIEFKPIEQIIEELQKEEAKDKEERAKVIYDEYKEAETLKAIQNMFEETESKIDTIINKSTKIIKKNQITKSDSTEVLKEEITVSEKLSKFYSTPEGKENKKNAHLKRSETMAKQREEFRSNLTEKTCSKCNTTRELSFFNNKNNSKDGYQ